jgi:hypothetical protein
MESFQPQQVCQSLETYLFFSNFDSGNMCKVEKVSQNSFEVQISPDAACSGLNSYKVWFYFGVKGFKKGSTVRLSIINLSYLKVFNSPSYRPVWRCLPSQPEWQRIQGETFYESFYGSSYKYTFTCEVQHGENDYYFAFTTPFSYSDIQKSVKTFEKQVLGDTYFFRETLVNSIDGRPVDLITISAKTSMAEQKEPQISGLFPKQGERCLAGKKPVVFITSRVHPGETPSSFVLDAVFQMVLSSDPRGVALRNSFVFKIVPVLNPDGVYRGHFRVDQNGVNLNRCYIEPSRELHPSVFAVKSYFEFLHGSIKYYFDLHAHASKRSCFLFGNSLEFEKQIENQLLAKLIEINSGFFEYSECDFSERSMTAKDPKDHHSKEGSGRVALSKGFGIVHCYTVECSYYILRNLHPVAPNIHLKTGKRVTEIPTGDSYVCAVYNRNFFEDVGFSILFALLDIEKVNPISRLPLSPFRYIESAREWIKARILAHYRLIGRTVSSREPLKGEVLSKLNNFPRLPQRKVHKMNVIAPVFNEPCLNLGQNRPIFSLGRVVNKRLDI